MSTTTDPNPSTAPLADENPQPEPETSQALVVRESRMAQLPPDQLLAQVRAWGRLMAHSGYFEDARHEAQAAVKVLFGLELGFTPGASMAGVHIIEGKPTLSASLQAQALRRSGRYDYRVTDLSDERCELEFYEIRQGKAVLLGLSEFSLADAERAELLNRRGRMWEKYPRNMLFSRALTNGITWFCPDAFEVGRVYTADELKPDLEMTSDGNVIDVGSITVEPAPQARQRNQQQGDRQPERQARQVQREASPRVEANPTSEPSPDGISNVGQLLTYGVNLRKFHGLPTERGAAEAALGVEAVGEIAAKYAGKWDEAAQKMRDAFVPTSAHVTEAEIVEPPPLFPPDREATALEARLGSMNAEQRAAYEVFIDDGVEPADALTAIGVE